MNDIRVLFCRVQGISHQECGQDDQQCYCYRKGNREKFPWRVVPDPDPLDYLVKFVYLFIDGESFAGVFIADQGVVEYFTASIWRKTTLMSGISR